LTNKEEDMDKVHDRRGPVRRAAAASATGTKKAGRLVGAAIVSGIIYDAAKSTATKAAQPKKRRGLRRSRRR
jgi:hypothetical protein